MAESRFAEMGQGRENVPARFVLLGLAVSGIFTALRTAWSRVFLIPDCHFEFYGRPAAGRALEAAGPLIPNARMRLRWICKTGLMIDGESPLPGILSLTIEVMQLGG